MAKIDESTNKNGFVKVSEFWYTRNRESVTRGSGCWYYYVNSIASGILHFDLTSALSTPQPV